MLKTGDGCNDVKCLYCGRSIEVWWDTEYGTPTDGMHTIVCPYCDMEMDVVVVTSTTYRPVFPNQKKEEGE